MIYHGISISQDKLTDFCRRNHVHQLALFGSILREDFRPDSDIDMLIEIEHGYPLGYVGLAGLELELSAMLGRKVDLRTLAELSRYFRDDVVANSEVIYAEGRPSPTPAHA